MRFIVLLFALFAFFCLAKSNVVYDAKQCPHNNRIRCRRFVCLPAMVEAACKRGPKCCTSNSDCEEHQKCCPPSLCSCIKQCQNITSH
ncbi:unnamed protein product [Adineta steineri]|uniref:WAP domain-containing protein n=1 Tax=Adineta steineri TaxID=433720 RepID=A0A820N0A2_9BILA|nr:unnamed protein product [Adineta steineri]CAF3950720.1 unnamed protein product [Adineta steineri]CAF4383749.1 unnamed protein product [Adineta steineri]